MSSKLMSMKFMQKARGIDPRQTEEQLSKPIVTDEHWSLKKTPDAPSNKNTCKIEYESSYGSLISKPEDNGDTQETDSPAVAGRASFGLFNKELEGNQKESVENEANEEEESDAPYKMEGLETTERERRNQERLSNMVRGKGNNQAKSKNNGQKKRTATDMDRDIISLDTEKSEATPKPKKKKNKNKKKKT